MISRERIDKGGELRQWIKDDGDAQRIVASICHAHGCPGYAELAEQHPEVFDELHETVRDFRNEDEGR